MERLVRIGLVLIALAGWAAFPARAADTDCKPGSFIELGYAGADVQDSEAANDQRGVSPEDWVASGRVFLPLNYFSPSRFELRAEDISQENGRAWARLTLWPATLEADGWQRDDYAWQQSGATLALTPQQSQYYDAKLRFHTGELDNLLVKYEHREFERDALDAAPLAGYMYDRLSAQYNFTVNERVRGQFRQVSNTTEAPRYMGAEQADTLTSLLKLEADLSDDWRLYGKTSLSTVQADYLPDDEMQASDTLLGVRYRPHCDWTFDANFETKQLPTDSTVTSRVEGVDALGASATWTPGGGDRVELGYAHRTLDYAQLHMQDEDLRPLLRSGAQLTQLQTSLVTTSSDVEQDEVYLNSRYQLARRWTLISKVRMLTGDAPGTDLLIAGRPSLYYDDRLQNYHRLEWDANGKDQFAFTHNATESSNSARGGNFDLRYLEGSWARCLGGNKYLTLAVGRTEAELDTPNVSSAYTTDDWSYALTLADDLPAFGYALDWTLTDGSGWEEYNQYAVGADLQLKRLGCGPVGLRVDWFDRNWDTNPLYNTQALEFAVTYKLEF
jgi:hypothetical protein